ncbi:MAG: hypothetical protein IPJ90_20370 [Anaerolineaceae bacterium]|nr:hypothetical protein [Anaerolineaceae bacterium]
MGFLETIPLWWRRDRWPLLLFLVATLLMTYPLALRLDGTWLASFDTDSYVKLWDIWWMRRVLTSGQTAYYTRELFYPGGLDLSFHSISWTVTGYALLLETFLPTLAAYNVTILTAVFTTGYAAYLLLLDLQATRLGAWLAGAIYTFAPYHLTHTGGHPDLTHLAPIPIAVLFFLRTYQRPFSPKIWRYGLVTAVSIAISAYTSLYIFDFLVLTLLVLFLFVALPDGRWRNGRFWQVTLWLGFVTAILLLPRLWPILQNSQALSTAIEQKYSATTGQTDLRALFVPSRFNPLFADWVAPVVRQFEMNRKWPAYVGLVPVLLAFVSLITALRRQQQRALRFTWALMGTMFLLLALGPVLRMNGVVYEQIRLPAAFLVNFPPVRAVGRPDFFMLGLLLALAVLAGLGASDMQRHLQKIRPALVRPLGIGLCLLLLFEFWNGPFPMEPHQISPFHQMLAAQTDTFALIDLPMGRQASKLYVWRQTEHHKPIVEGLSARTPPEAYSTIEANPLLSRWRHTTPLDCETLGAAGYETAVAQLIQNNFRYIILHKTGSGVPELTTEAAYFTAVPIYDDAQITVFDITTLAAANPCPAN